MIPLVSLYSIGEFGWLLDYIDINVVPIAFLFDFGDAELRAALEDELHFTTGIISGG